MARDLRFLAAIPEIITELERIGDYAKGIAQINIRLGDEPLLKPLIDIPKMAEKGLNMLRRSLEAFVQRDTAAARTIPDEDEEVGRLYNEVYRELLQIMINDPKTVDRATLLLWTANNMERLADRVTNSC
jgi:phosphate transport system protein